MDLVVEVENLQKSYGKVVAVEEVSFAVGRGEIFGIVGSNGAGKTTTVECLAGLRTPDRGTVRILGMDPRREARKLRQRIGVQLQEAALPDNTKVWEALDLYASFYREPADCERLLEQWGSWRSGIPGSRTSPAARNSGSLSPSRSSTGPSSCFWMRSQRA